MNTKVPVPVLNIIGPVGIGKSSTADAISEFLEYDHALPHAVVDLDHVRRGFPPPKDDPFNKVLGFNNLAAVWNNYRSFGAKCLIIPSVMESDEDLNKIRLSVPGADLFLVRLVASLDVNHARIRGREKTVDSLNWHLKRSTQLAEELAVKKLEHVVVDTENKSPSEIAREIIRKWGIVEWHTKSC
ncbi:hypothetical protein [Paenibacillus sp. OV219]|uniref:hypothetical protein n=1 Tax=Paenibacillus sp. OV219 TaxID=1884377 RepID=UPI0008BB2E8E|nr:hypothetical protein [Paenibacillus sp. OV219]SEM79586.1 hypothetical protein SAMN05518847_101819 [Paenibacillus sp. OV219]